MARRSLINIPGFEGKMLKYQQQLGIQLPIEFIQHIEKQLEELNVEATIQTVMKVALVAIFPVPDYEEETTLMLRKFFSGQPPTLPTREKWSDFEKESTPGVEVPTKPRMMSLFTNKPEVKKPEIKEEPESQIEDTDYKVVARSEKSGVTLSLLSVVLDNPEPYDFHTWQHKEFFKTKDFIQDQSKAVSAIQHEALQMPKEEFADAIENSLFKLFPEAWEK